MLCFKKGTQVVCKSITRNKQGQHGEKTKNLDNHYCTLDLQRKEIVLTALEKIKVKKYILTNKNFCYLTVLSIV